MGRSIINWGGVVDDKLLANSDHPLSNKAATAEFLRQQNEDTRLHQKIDELVTQSKSITQPGIHALDATQNNASIKGSLANQITTLQSNLTKLSMYNLIDNDAPNHHSALNPSKSHGTWVARIGNIVQIRLIFLPQVDIPSQTRLVTIPPGFRPCIEVKTICSSNGGLNQCRIDPNGEIYLDFPVPASNDVWVFIHETYLCNQ